MWKVKITTPEGIIGNDSAGESQFTVNFQNGNVKSFADKGAVSLNNGKNIVPVKAQDDDDNKGGGFSAAGPLIIFAGIVAAAVIYVVVNNNDDDNIVSPVR